MKRKVWYFDDAGQERSALVDEAVIYALIDGKNEKIKVVE